MKEKISLLNPKLGIKITNPNETLTFGDINQNPLIHVKYKDNEIYINGELQHISPAFLLYLHTIFSKQTHIPLISLSEKNLYNIVRDFYPMENLMETIKLLEKILQKNMKIDFIHAYLIDREKKYPLYQFNKDLNFSFPYLFSNSFNDFSILKSSIEVENERSLEIIIFAKREKLYLDSLVFFLKIKPFLMEVIKTAFHKDRFKNILIQSLEVLSRAQDARIPGAIEHSINVVKLAKKIGEKLGLSKNDLWYLELGGWIFDIGKIGIRDELFNKKGPLTPEEFEEIKAHVKIGYEIVSKIPSVSKEVKEIVLYHHERWNGEGYIKGLKGNEIPLLAQIIGIVDSYCSMIEDRPYRSRMSKEMAIENIKKYSGIFFNPKLVKILSEVIENGG